jgi:hypothetical protein
MANAATELWDIPGVSQEYSAGFCQPLSSDLYQAMVYQVMEGRTGPRQFAQGLTTLSNQWDGQ